MPTRSGSIHLFRFAGVDLYLHWSWFVVAMLEISGRRGSYGSLAFNVLEYVTLFVIVLMHELGHALACRSVGGRADEIVLWPLGGVAYVSPPMRPGATLWSIAAGPLVNVAMLAGLIGFWLMASAAQWPLTPDLIRFLQMVGYINAGLLVFNLLPIYPLDGGQIVRSLLWYVMGRARSLLVVTVIGFIGVAAIFVLVAFMALNGQVQRSIWYGVIALFILANCWRGLTHARQLAKADKLPRRTEFACPSCGMSPPIGAWWTCGQCGRLFDAFQTQGVCPYCATRFTGARCLDCGESNRMDDWRRKNPPAG